MCEKKIWLLLDQTKGLHMARSYGLGWHVEVYISCCYSLASAIQSWATSQAYRLHIIIMA